MLKQAGISGGVSSELRSAAVKMVFVEEENTSEPEPLMAHFDMSHQVASGNNVAI